MSANQEPPAPTLTPESISAMIVDSLNKNSTLHESSSRKPFTSSFTPTRAPNPAWQPGSGANDDEWKKHETISIDPYEPGRSAHLNYRLLISGIVPRPIGFISTIDKSGKPNLAPYSYSGLFCSDPPTFAVSPNSAPRDTRENLLATGECTINIISDWFVEAANYTSIVAPPELSEWALSGLTPAPTKVVKPARVAESAFAVECRLIHHYDIVSPATGKRSATLCVLQGVYFHVREDAIDLESNQIKTEVLKPVSRLGGIMYSAVKEGFEIERPQFGDETKKPEVQELLEKAKV